MKIRVGLPSPSGKFLGYCLDDDVPVLVSANSLWDDTRQRFRSAFPFSDLDWALDSGGFVAMARYGRYRWRIDQYAIFAWEAMPTWYSAMDFCCEPEVAAERGKVRERVLMTAQSLFATRDYVDLLNQEVGDVLPARYPVPILQGWRPDDYLLSVDVTTAMGLNEWPDVVGIGSVCRRALGGEDGLFRILETLDNALPRHVKFHLFGVKGEALDELGGWDRIASIDSMAWSFSARQAALKAGVSKNRAFETAHLHEWRMKAEQRVARSRQQFRLDLICA